MLVFSINDCFELILSGYTENHMANKAIDLFNKIENPDEVIIVVLLNACAQLGGTEALDLVTQVSLKPAFQHLFIRTIVFQLLYSMH